MESNFNTDGFAERKVYINNANDRNRIENNGPSNIDSSFAQMKSEERKTIVETTNNDQEEYVEEARGNKENFVLRNNAMDNVFHKPMQNDPVNRAMNRNLFNPFKK